MLLSDFRNRFDVDDFQQRVGRRLQPDEFRLRRDRGFEFFRVGEIDVSERKPGRLAPHPFEQAEGAAIDVVHGDHMAAGGKKFEHGGDGRHAGGEGEAARSVFKIGDAALIGETRRVGAAGVDEAFMYAGAFLRVG